MFSKRAASMSASSPRRIAVCASEGKRADLKLVGSLTCSTFSFSSDGRKACGSGLHRDRKSTRLNSSHSQISYAVFCLKKKKKHTNKRIQDIYMNICVA